MPFRKEGNKRRREVEEALRIGSPRAQVATHGSESTQQILHMHVQLGPSMPGWR
jgi:hypothetical protein